MTPGPANEIHLGIQTQTEDDSGSELGHQANKRPRIGSVVTTDAPLQLESFPKTTSSSTLVPPVHSSDEMDQVMPPVHKALSSSEFGFDTDRESTTNPAGSTIAQALNLRSKTPPLHTDDSDSAFVPVGLPSSSRSPTLGPSSRALIKEFFSNAERFEFPKGHPTVAFTEDQISSVLKVVADEAVRASCGVMEKLIQKTSELHLGTGPRQPRSPGRSVSRSPHRASSRSSGRLSDTSGAIRSDDDFSNIGYSYEDLDIARIIVPPGAGERASCSRQDLQSNTEAFSADSPGGQTLASLKAEALYDQSKRARSKQKKSASSSRGTGTRRKVTRSCKIMKEAYFQGMEWTRTFVSGPVDPRWNPYKFYCQICKANISIYGKGAREILRHHSTEKQLRRDQRWRYEYLYTIDPVTRTKVHQVRGRDGKLLTPYQLELLLPFFKNAQLVEIGQKLPFCDEYMAGQDHMSSSSNSRARVQLSVLAKFLPSNGDLEVLKSFWSDVGVIVNHKTLFTDFN